MFHFGVLCSDMHMAWVKVTAGRLKSDLRYSAKYTYNTFPWPVDANGERRDAIRAAAQAVLTVRAQFPDASLADMYDPLSMPSALDDAHRTLDKAVDAAYGYRGAKDDAARVAFLFALYQQLVGDLTATPRGKRKAARV